MKKIILLLTILSLTLGSAFTSFAAEQEEVFITAEEYESMLNEVYSKYDSKVEIVDTNGKEYISKKVAEQSCLQAEITLKENQGKVLEIVGADIVQGNVVETEVINDEILEFVYDENTKDIIDPLSSTSPRVMPMPFFFATNFTFYGGLGNVTAANFRFELEGTVNAQYNSFMDIDRAELFENGMAANFMGYSMVANQDGLINGSTAYNLKRTLDLQFGWTDPLTGYFLKETVRRSIDRTIYGTENQY